MFECNLCQPMRTFESGDAYNIHKNFHVQSEQQVVKELEEKENNKVIEEALNSIEDLGKTLEVSKMALFSKEEPKQDVTQQPNIVRQYLFELQLEVIETKDKKFIKVLEEINKKILELMNDNYDIVVKHQKTEKQF